MRQKRIDDVLGLINNCLMCLIMALMVLYFLNIY